MNKAPFRSSHCTTPVAIGFLFFVNGIVFASWATNIPFIQQRYDLTKGEIGTVLLLMAAGAVVFMTLTNRLVRWMGGRFVSMLATQCFAFALMATLWADTIPFLIVSVILLGAANGSMDVAMNRQAAQYETLIKQPIMSRFHGCFSVGALLGAVATFATDWVGASPVDQTVVTLVLVLGVGLALYSGLLTDRVESGKEQNHLSFELLKKDNLLVLGLLSFLTMMSEGAIADWSTLFLIDYSAMTSGTAALGFATYASTMIIGRLSGDQVTGRIGRRRLVQLSGGLTSLGIALVLFGWPTGMKFLGFAILGFGIANLVPVVFSTAATRNSVHPGSGITIVSVAGYSGFLVGPALIGWLAAVIGLDRSLLVVLVAGLAFLLMARIFEDAGHSK